MRSSVLFVLFLAVSAAGAANLHGKVVNQSTGESLSNVAVSLLDTSFAVATARDGSFLLSNVPAGKYVLRIDGVGFWFHRMPVEVVEGDSREFAIALTPQGARRTETVEVKADIFEGEEPAQTAEMNLTVSEVKQSDTVSGGDLFRAVQAMPGITGQSNNDFFAQFMVLGAPFNQVGVYIDDVLVRQPFHGIPGQSDGASIGVMNDEIVEGLSLTPIAFSEKYSEATGGVLDIRSREGNRERTRVSVGAGMAESHVTAEGGIGKNRGSWLVSGRRSYLGYLTDKSVGGNSPIEPSFTDLDAHVAYELTPKHTIDFTALEGLSSISDSWIGHVNPNMFFTGKSSFSLLRLGWRAALSPTVLLSTYGAYTAQQDSSKNQAHLQLNDSDGAEWVGGSDLGWSWKPKQTFEAGWVLRRLTGFRDNHYYDATSETAWNGQAGTGLRQGGYVQQRSELLRGRLQLTGSLRWDQFSMSSLHPISPQAAASLRIAPATDLILGAGRYTQFPGVEYATDCLTWGPRVLRSTHYLVGVERRLTESTRLRVEGFSREDRQQFGFGSISPNTGTGSCAAPDVDPSYSNKTFTRGGQIVLQRRSSNRLSGWVSYTLLHQRDHLNVFVSDSLQQGFSEMSVPGFGDQRHAVNAVGMYRLRPSFGVSAKLLYGSGYPGVPTSTEPVTILLDGVLVDRVLTNTFFRLDLRADKALRIRGQKLTFHAELLNSTNHMNIRYVGYRSVSLQGQPTTVLSMYRSIGVTPTAGIELQF